VTSPPAVEIAPAKINLALHVRRRRSDGRHDIETIFAFCTDGDRLTAELADDLSLTVTGPFAAMIDDGPGNLVHRAASTLAAEARVGKAAALRLLTGLWGADPALAERIAPALGSDVPACLLSLTARGEGAGDALTLVDAGVAGKPVLLVNPRVPLSTAAVFASWDGADRGPLGNWREGRNDLEVPARLQVPAIGRVLDWMQACEGVEVARMSGSGATCFALFADEEARDEAAGNCPPDWWHMASFLR
jgi:4-diphosphocytidyl-2-C-methyl-D-erythritol kinase